MHSEYDNLKPDTIYIARCKNNSGYENSLSIGQVYELVLAWECTFKIDTYCHFKGHGKKGTASVYRFVDFQEIKRMVKNDR